MTIGELIRAKRKKLGMSQTRLGEELGVTKGTILSWEMEKTIPNKINLKRISEILNIEESEMLFSDGVYDRVDSPYSSGFIHANKLANQLIGLFAGGELTERDKEAIMLTLQRAYIACKRPESPE